MEDFGSNLKKWQKNRNFWYTVIFLFSFYFILLLGRNLAIAADAPNIVTYQGKLLINGSVATTTQSMKFVMYDSLSGGSALYTASGTLGTPTAVSTTVSNGFFTVNLGDTGTNSLDPAVFKNNAGVYLEVIIGSETLSPRKRLTAAPYAFNAKYLDGIAASSTALFSVYIPISDSGGNFNFNNVTSTGSNVANLSWTNATSTGNTNLVTLTTTATTTLATTTITSSTIGNLNVTNTTTVSGLLRITGNAYFGTIASGTWNGTAISNVYGGTGQNSSGWTGFVKVTAGTWSTSTISVSDLSNSSTLAFLASNQTFTGNNTFSATTTFATATFNGIGIGTTTPQEKLHIYDGNLRVDTPVNPTSVGSYNTTGNALNIKVSGKYAYVADGTSGLEIFDVTLPISPALVSTYDTDGTAYDVEVVGRYAYVADDTSGLLIIDVENPGIPRLVGSYNTSGNAISVYVSGKYAYVADQTGGLRIIDVSNPYSPVLISTISATSADDVYVRGKYAYLADNGGGFKVIDISDPINPVTVTSTGSGLANGVHVIGRFAYVSFNTSTNNIISYNISNPTSTSQTDIFTTTNAARGAFFSGNYLYAIGTTTLYVFNPGTLAIIGSYTLNQTNALTIVGKYAYIANGTSGFSIIDIKGADLTAANIGSVSTNNLTVWENVEIGNNISVRSGLNVGMGGILSNGPLAINFSSQTTTSLFSVSASSSPVINILGDGKVGIGTTTPQQKLHVYDGTLLVDSPANPTLSGSLAITSPRSVYVSGKYAYALTTDGLTVINIEDKNYPRLIGTLSISGISTGFERSVIASGRYVYLTANASNTLYIVDVSNPKSPSVAGSITDSSLLRGAIAVYVSGNYAYVAANNTSTVAIVDVANPASPVVVGSVTDGTKLSSVAGIYVAGRYAYAVSSDNSYFVVIDVANPSAPSIVGSFTDGTNMGGPRSIYVSGNYAYVAGSFTHSLATVDITDPTAPFLTGALIDATNLNGPFSVYVSGKYAYVAARDVNTFAVVDISATNTPRLLGTYTSGSNINGISSVFVSGKYVYATSIFSANLTIFNLKGADIHAANIGNITSNDLTVWENSDVGNNLYVRNALNVGIGGIQSNGQFSINSNVSSGNLFQIVSSTNSSIFAVSAAGNVVINTSSFGGAAYKLRIDAGGISNGAIGVNGIIRATSYITASTTLDLAETYPVDLGCAANGTCPVDGDVVCTDSTIVSGVKKCSALDSANIIGIVSANPGFLLGGGEFSNPVQNLGTVKVALAGRVPVKVSSLNGVINPGDKLTLSNVDGVAAKAIGEVPIVGIAMQGYSGNEQGEIITFVSLGWQSQLYRGLTLDTNSSTLNLGTDLTPYNFNLTGDLVMSNNLLNKIIFNGSAQFQSKTNDTQAFIFDAANFGSASNNYILSLRSNNEPRFSVMSNGDVHANGNIYAAGAVFGTSTNPGDLAERVDIASDEVVEAGDVMSVDMNNADTYRRSSGAYSETVAGVISTNPTIVVGNGKTQNTALMAMVGRVPIKVSNENGEIKKGDLLVTASLPGYAMRYDNKKDNGLRSVSVIGLALEDMATNATGKIMGLVRTGWINNSAPALSVVKDDLQKIATAQGVSLSSNKNLNIQTVDGNLTYNNGNLDLQGNQLLNVSSIVGKNSRWLIDVSGQFITRLNTTQGEKDMFALQSPNAEFVFSSSSQMVSGEAKIMFDQYVQEIIDQQQPMKINITLTSGEAKGIYVSEKSPQGFTVKELNDGHSNATFDWIVVAKRKSDQQSVIPDFINNLINNQSSNTTPVLNLDLITSSTQNSNTNSSTALSASLSASSTEETISVSSTLPSDKTTTVVTPTPPVESVSTSSASVSSTPAAASEVLPASVSEQVIAPVINDQPAIVTP